METVLKSQRQSLGCASGRVDRHRVVSVGVGAVEEERPTSTFGSRPEALVGSTCAFSWEHMGLHPGPVTLHMHM